MRVELVKKKQWFYRIVAANGETVLVSETFKTKWNAKRQASKIAQANHLPLKVVR